MCFARAHRALSVIIISLVSTKTATSQVTAQPVSLPFTYQHVLRSQVNGREYKVMVALPAGYGNGAPDDTARFPVLYMLDGGISLPLVSAMYRYGNITGIAPTIFVGIGWVTKNVSAGPPPERTEDFTPTVVSQDDSLKTGGAARFARILREEIIPFIERTYRTNGDRGILGNSYGGLFEVYTLLEDPDLFQKYIIGSPSLWWDNGVMFARESIFARANHKMPKRIYLAVGSDENETMRDVTRRFADSLRAHHYEGLELTTEVFPDEGHSGVLTAYQGLKWLYPFLATCRLRREGGGSYKGQCTRMGTLVADVNISAPSAQSRPLWRGWTKFPWRSQPDSSAVDMRRGGSLRAGPMWFDVKEAQIDSSSAAFLFDVDRGSRPTQTDLAIIRRAKSYLARRSQWDRAVTPDSLISADDSFSCPRSARRSFFCALYDASVAENGDFWGGRPAISAVRAAVTAASARPLKHPLFDINSDAATTLASLQKVLDDAERRIRERLLD